MIKVIEHDLVPQLKEAIPHQPSEEQYQENPLLHRFVMVFDREGYSPEFMVRMKEQQIACQTYHKHPGENWPVEEFHPQEVTSASGHVMEMDLAERGTFLGKRIWVREIRKLCKSGRQTSVLSTNYVAMMGAIAGAMFARWSQENFFKYMRENYSLDALADYSTESIPDATRIVNPEHRRVDGEVRKAVGKRNRARAKFAALTLQGDIAPARVEDYQQKKGDLQENIEQLDTQVTALKAARKAINKHITVGELPAEERFNQLSTQSKYLVDTVKMIAYRAETAMVNICRETMSHPDEVRHLLRSIYNTEADIVVDGDVKTLTVQIHHLANRVSSITVQQLCEELTATETQFPGTEFRIIYTMVSPPNP
jgi:hypothetical protein